MTASVFVPSVRRLIAATVTVLVCAIAGAAFAQGPMTGPSWVELTAAERLALQPLQSQWHTIDTTRKQKWREIAIRLPAMPRDQQIRMQARMTEWANMTPTQRNTARLHFETTKQVPVSEKQALWNAYQAIPDDQRKALADKAVQRKTAEIKPQAAPAAGPASQSVGFDRTQAKSNLVVANKPGESQSRPTGPSTVQASVGVSTRPLTQRPAPPRHQQAGMPKIAATPGFVNGSTLLPQRGPQGAAGEPVTAEQ